MPKQMATQCKKPKIRGQAKNPIEKEMSDRDSITEGKKGWGDITTHVPSLLYVSLYCGADQMAPIKVFVLHENKKMVERSPKNSTKPLNFIYFFAYDQRFKVKN